MARLPALSRAQYEALVQRAGRPAPKFPEGDAPASLPAAAPKPALVKAKQKARGAKVRGTLKSPLEHEEQVALFRWMAQNVVRYPELGNAFAIPNGLRVSRSQAGKARAEGMKKGVPDIFCPCASRGGWLSPFIELKRVKGGTLGPEQAKWLKNLRASGFLAVRCNGCAQAVALLEWYFSLPAGLARKRAILPRHLGVLL